MRKSRSGLAGMMAGLIPPVPRKHDIRHRGQDRSGGQQWGCATCGEMGTHIKDLTVSCPGEMSAEEGEIDETTATE